MKKYFYIVMAVAVMTCTMAGCSSKKAEESSAASADTEVAQADAEETAGRVNPMVAVDSDAAFEENLGIIVDTSELSKEPQLFIVADKIAECQYTFKNIMGKEIECVFRATKDEELSENLHGVYGELERTNKIEYKKGTVVNINNVKGDEKATVCTWQCEDTYYSMLIKGEFSQMEFASVMDSAMRAIGIL